MIWLYMTKGNMKNIWSIVFLCYEILFEEYCWDSLNIWESKNVVSQRISNVNASKTKRTNINVLNVNEKFETEININVKMENNRLIN